MNCDRIAPFYEGVEKAVFGGRLQRHRTIFLAAAEGKRHALVLGDGDGRFSAVLARTYPKLHIDCVEISAGMLAQARRRLACESHVKLIQADAFEVRLPEAHYDVIFTHFFLDCFDTESVAALLRRFSLALASRAVWVVTDFREIKNGWRRAYTRAWLTVMYLFFRYTTGLKTQALPEYESELARAGFSRRKERVSMAGLIASEWWQR